MSEFLDIQALADGQLEGEAKAQAAERILSDPQARAEYETVGVLKQTLKRACPPTPEPDVWQACRARLDGIDKSKRAEVFIGRNAWALCGIFVVLIFSAGLFNRINSRNKVYTSDVARMMSSMSPLPFSVQGPDDVQKQLEAQLGSAPIHVPSQGLRPTGMLRGYLNGRRAMLVDLADRVGSARLIVIENIHEVEGLGHEDAQAEYCVGKLNNVNAVSWQSDEFICILVGDRDVTDLCAAAAQVRIVR